MSTENLISVKTGVHLNLQVKESFVLILLSIVLPFLIHFFPAFNGNPAGAIFLAMFIAPYLAVVYYRFHVGLITALSSPFINYLITGSPKPELVPLITLQLALFVVASKLISGFNFLKYFNSLLSYIITIFFSAILIMIFPSFFSSSGISKFLQTAFITGIPGVFILFLINYTLIKFNKN